VRDFSEADKEKKKRERVRLEENPANLSGEKLAELETAVKSSIKDGYLSCPVAWQIAKKAQVPKLAVGAVTDKLGLRVTDCQLGCFKVDKTPYNGSVPQEADAVITARLEELARDNKITCAEAFELAREMKITPRTVAEAVNIKGMKIRDCQLGCF
jgi:hypothetical protein